LNLLKKYEITFINPKDQEVYKKYYFVTKLSKIVYFIQNALCVNGSSYFT